MKYFLSITHNLKNLKKSEILISLLILFTIPFLYYLNKIVKPDHLYGGNIFLFDYSLKKNLIIFVMFYLIYLIILGIKKILSFNFDNKKTIFFLILIISLYKIYIYGFPFDFKSLDDIYTSYFIDNKYNYYKSIHYISYLIKSFLPYPQYTNSFVQVLFGIISLITIFLLFKKFSDKKSLYSITTVLLLIIYMPWNMVETLIGPDPLFSLIFYLSILFSFKTINNFNTKDLIVLNLLFIIGIFTKDTFIYMSLLILLYILFAHKVKKYLTISILIINVMITSSIVSNINVQKYGIESFYKNQVYLLKIMTYGYLNPNIKKTYENSLSDDARILLNDIDKQFKINVTPHKREPFYSDKAPKFWINLIRPDFETIALKPITTIYKANVKSIMKNISDIADVKLTNNQISITSKEIISIFENEKKKFNDFNNREMVTYMKNIVFDGYLLNDKMCLNLDSVTFDLKCFKRTFNSIENLLLDRSDNWYYKKPALDMAANYNPISKTYSSHEKIDYATEIILKKPLLYISQSILSFFGDTGFLPIPTALGDALTIFKKNNTPKFLTHNLQHIFYPIINFWYLYCIFSFLISILFINNLNIKNKNIFFSIIPIYFGALISFFSMGEAPRQMLLVMPFIFYNFLVVMNFIFSKINHIIFNTQYEKY